MRSQALQAACRPLRSPSSTLQPLKAFQSRPITTSRPKSGAYTSKPSYNNNASTTATKKPVTSSSSSTAPKINAPSAKPYAPSQQQQASAIDIEEMPIPVVLDPQAAQVPGATIEDVDPELAAQIPTPTNSNTNNGAGKNKGAFTAALTGGGGNGKGYGAAQQTIDWSSSYHGLSTEAFSPEVAKILMQPLDPLDVEVKPDGIIYLPEIKYRRILNQAFGPGGWGLAPRGELVVGEKVVTREYALIVGGRFVAQARGECQYFSEETIPTAGEGCKSNALLRCCKDLGIASELWDPRFIREFKKKYAHEIWVEHIVNKKRRQVWCRKDADPWYPYQIVKKTA
ncbi:mitochondrial genome maintenance MGM101-domain-containing protein [Pseudoneurospora amorphoporcata]|uniref:Mitochondrial genome maintenance protein MGM101 n=1 Tax=Pseudoneurospora amorphoporcata TaxID=241081 RepID=A0AAN6NTZ3_9PEZI|nr:mitochondrial genome maintenance MGM101-domain-containing protein [Pseudoneurospora amorphoporcata]